jgi:hypothetical protein
VWFEFVFCEKEFGVLTISPAGVIILLTPAPIEDITNYDDFALSIPKMICFLSISSSSPTSSSGLS